MSAKAQILIVDDEPSLLRMMSYNLAEKGYAVRGAQTGEEALTMIGSEQPDLVILDVMMPGMDGIEVCRRLRANEATAALPVIMLSAKIQVQDKIAGIEAGADEYLEKPIAPEEMAARVAGLLDRVDRLAGSHSSEQATVIGFVGAKGGTGTTTMCLNVATSLVTRSHDVIVAEMRTDPGSFAFHLGRTPVETLADLMRTDVSRIGPKTLKRMVVDHPTGLRVLFGPQHYADDAVFDAEHTEAVLDGLRSIAQYVILDVARQPSAAMEAAVGMCDHIVLVVEREPGSIAAAKPTIAMLQEWGVSLNMISAIVVNRARLSINVSAADIASHLDCEMLGVVPAAEAFVMAQESGTPLVVLQPDSDPARTIAEMAGRLTAAHVAAAPS